MSSFFLHVLPTESKSLAHMLLFASKNVIFSSPAEREGIKRHAAEAHKKDYCAEIKSLLQIQQRTVFIGARPEKEELLDAFTNGKS